MATVLKSGQMVPNTRASGPTAKPQDMGSSSTSTETSTTESGSKTKPVVTGSTCTTTALVTRANGSKTTNTATE